MGKKGLWFLARAVAMLILIGLVVAVHPDLCPPAQLAEHRLREIGELLPPAYRLAPDRLHLAHWLTDYYGLAVGEVIPLFHPPAPGT